MEDVGETPPAGNCGMSQASSGNSALETAITLAWGLEFGVFAFRISRFFVFEV